MSILIKYSFFFLILPLFCFPQSDTIGKVRYTTDFIFNDGVYTTFQEFRNNNPSIREFTIKKPSQFANPGYTILDFEYADTKQTKENSQYKNVWGYSYHGDVYIAHSYNSYFYKLMIIGSVCHFVGLENSIGVNPYNSLMLGYESEQNYQQFMLDIETGEINTFNFKNFSNFLKTHDVSLYQELIKEKKKKKKIFKYLLKYNEKYPVFFQYD